MVTLLSALYGRATALRRSWYTGRRDRQRRLSRPVISIGNLSVGGSGKTPLVAHLAALLQTHGERPAVLTRGYRRRDQSDGVVVASDGSGVREPVEKTGDEPQLLARTLTGVPVLVSADRHLAGTLAERRFGCTVHLLDDGLQHLALARDVELVVLSPGDLDDALLPSGRLREPLDVAATADALVVGGTADDAAPVEERFPGMPVFLMTRHFHPLRTIDGAAVTPPPRRVLAVAGIARPERFFAALRDQGFEVAGELRFRDHHWFTDRDLQRAAAAAAAAGADGIVTTEKDAMRLGGRAPRWAVLPMTVSVEPAGLFERWLLERLEAARRA